MEEWRDVKDYIGLYQVSNLGRVRSIFRYKKILKPVKCKSGYLFVGLCKDGVQKNIRVHRLVAEAFIPNPDNYNEVNHIDENPSNNCVENLEWCSHKYNINYGNRGRKISQYTLQGEFIKEWKSAGEAGRKTKISENSIRYVCRGLLNKAGNFIWRYSDE